MQQRERERDKKRGRERKRDDLIVDLHIQDPTENPNLQSSATSSSSPILSSTHLKPKNNQTQKNSEKSKPLVARKIKTLL